MLISPKESHLNTTDYLTESERLFYLFNSISEKNQASLQNQNELKLQHHSCEAVFPHEQVLNSQPGFVSNGQWSCQGSSALPLEHFQQSKEPPENSCDILTPELINDIILSFSSNLTTPESLATNSLPSSEIITPLSPQPISTLPFNNSNWTLETPLFETTNTFDLNQFINNQISHDFLSSSLNTDSIPDSEMTSIIDSSNFLTPPLSLDTPYSLAASPFARLPVDFSNSYLNGYDLFPPLNDVTSSSPHLLGNQSSPELQQESSNPFDSNLLESLTQIINSSESNNVSLQFATLLAALSTIKSGPEIMNTLRKVVTTSELIKSEDLAPTGPVRTPKQRRTSTLHACDHLGCDKAFTRRSNLTAHKKTHDPNRDRPFTCEICLKAFIRAHDLTRHQPVHTKVKEFDCEKCGKLFTRKDAKDRHFLQGKCK
ncbi:hypothetical protein HK096_004262 [Nowakowskiella sp. JEL0078]|nr:hypothetical protein HK096_004262 [Nowakowskiella sp. JEL0078]